MGFAISICKRILFLLPVLLTGTVSAQYYSLFRADSVTVTASRLFSPLAEGYREAMIFTIDSLSAVTARSVPGILSLASPVSMQVRGPGGSQADISMRGSTFEQVLVLIDGVPVNDPQTGHHIMDIPVPLASIKRIEILPGHASSIYGAGAWGGVIHIITNTDSRVGYNASLQYGSHRSADASLSCSVLTGSVHHNFSYQGNISDGHRPGTDFRNHTGSYTASVNTGRTRLTSFLGISDKRFGAANFYAPYPSREKTSAMTGRISYTRQVSHRTSVSARVFSRFHTDAFKLDHTDQNSFFADHRSSTFGLAMQANMMINTIEIVLGSSMIHDRLSSSTLGQRDQDRSAVFTETAFPLWSTTSVHTGIRIDWQGTWPVQVNPSVSIKQRCTGTLALRASAGRIFRAPTFTELYYDSPANLGSKDLKPEHGWSFEAGLTAARTGSKHDITFFLRNEKDRIDWIMYSGKLPWEAKNRGAAGVSGVSASSYINAGKAGRFRSSVTWMARNIYNDGDYTSKYRCAVPRFQASVSYTRKISSVIEGTASLQYSDNPALSSFLLINTALKYNLGIAAVSISVNNILDEHYVLVPGNEMPGRTLHAGIYFGTRKQ